MSKARLPTELELTHEDAPIQVRFDYSRGEDQWFDARAGVGGPGCDPSVSIVEVNFGQGWQSPDAHPQLDFSALEDEILVKLAEMESADYDAYYQGLCDSMNEPTDA